MFRKTLLSLLFCGLCFGVVSTTTSRISYSTGSSVVAFTFPFPIVSTSDLIVILRTTSTGAESVLAETTNYTVSATNNDYSAGGTITTVSTYASGYTLLIMRNTPQTQGTDLDDSGTRRFEAIEQALDKLTYLTQQHQTTLDRCLKISRSDSTSLATEIDDSVNRASKNLTFDANGGVTATSNLNTGTANISTFGASVIDDADAAAAMATLTLNEKSISLLSSTASCNLAATAGVEKTLYTVPAGKSAIIIYVVMRTFSADCTTAVITLGLGSTTAEDFLGDQTLTGITTSYASQYLVLMKVPNATPVVHTIYTETQTFVMEITTAGATSTCTIDVFGYLF